MSEAVEIRGLVKRYGSRTAVDGLDLTVARGSVTAVLGPNGAGKTTTIKVLATLLEPSSGQALVDGIDVIKHPLEVRKVMGYMPDFFGVYDDVKVW